MVRFRIEVNRNTCIGDGLCCEKAPLTFKRDEDEMKVYILNPGGDPAEEIESAAQNCRLDAITLYDIASGEKVWPRF